MDVPWWRLAVPTPIPLAYAADWTWAHGHQIVAVACWAFFSVLTALFLLDSMLAAKQRWNQIRCRRPLT